MLNSGDNGADKAGLTDTLEVQITELSFDPQMRLYQHKPTITAARAKQINDRRAAQGKGPLFARLADQKPDVERLTGPSALTALLRKLGLSAH